MIRPISFGFTFYGYLHRIRSSRLLEKECHRNVEVLWLMRQLRPDFKTIADFRKDNRRSLLGVSREFIGLCHQMKLFGAQLVGIDGTKLGAVNSKDANFNEKKLEPLLARAWLGRVGVLMAPPDGVDRSEDRFQDQPAVRDERHEEAQHDAHDDGRDLAVLDVHPNEHEALDRQDRGGHHRERRPPVEGGGDDQADRADEFEDAEDHPGFPRQRTKGRYPLAYLVEHEDLLDARRSVQERGEDLQDPQQDVHRVHPPGFRVRARRAISFCRSGESLFINGAVA